MFGDRKQWLAAIWGKGWVLTEKGNESILCCVKNVLFVGYEHVYIIFAP